MAHRFVFAEHDIGRSDLLVSESEKKNPMTPKIESKNGRDISLSI